MRIKRNCGAYAWVGLATYVAVYDYIAIKTDKETLSEAFGRSLKHPIARWITLSSTFITMKHLLTPQFFPQADPFARLADKWRGLENA